MAVKWVRDADGNFYLGMIGNGQRITLTKAIDGWIISFGAISRKEHVATLYAAELAGIALAREILTECLVNLSEPNYTLPPIND